ncbi:hypothetical protein ABZP36_023428 [Zizania latifolia]
MHADTTPSSNGAAPPEPVSTWTRRHDKLLELLLWRWRLNPPWVRVAAHLGDKTPIQAFLQYLLMDMELRHAMEAPEVETPPEWDLQETAAPAPTSEQPAARMVIGAEDADMPAPMVIGAEDADMPVPTVIGAEHADMPAAMVIGAEHADTPEPPANGGETIVFDETSNKKKRGGPRRKPEIWTTEEHRLFLAGIEKHGKGKWKTLAREFVKTKSSTQIASHYQKFTIRGEKRQLNLCKRKSIHDITGPPPPPSPPTRLQLAATGQILI